MRLAIFLVFSALIFFQSCSSSGDETYQLSITPVPQEGGMVTPSDGEFDADRTLEISATPNQHWMFVRWEGDHEGTDNPVIITLDSDKDIAAIFEKRDYPLTIETIGEGSVSEQIVQQKTTEYPHGTMVELTAIPDEGWDFDGWQGDLDGDENPAVVTVDGETTVTAVFTRIEYPLTINITGEGEVEQQVVQPKTTDYPEGTVVELTAIADENWIFSDWSGDLESEENPEIITVDGPKEVTATFLRTYQLTTIAQPEQGGRVVPDDTVYVRDTDIEVEAIPNQGWRFINWEGDFTGSHNPFSLTMNGNKTIVGNFEREEFTVDIDTEGEGNVQTELISGTETENGFLFESEVEITAIPEEGWEFTGWDGYVMTDENPIQVTVTENIDLIAIFVGQVPEVSTDTVTNISANSADVTATIVDEKAYPIDERGVCFAETDMPGLDDLCVIADDTVNDTYTVTITGLEPESTYYVRAYAISEAGIGYGESQMFTTKLADIDGNIYSVVEIGDQAWMGENLRTTRYQEGDQITHSENDWSTQNSGAWSYYQNDSANGEIYGKLYNGFAALDERNVCPAGWRVPTDEDWAELENTLGMPQDELDETGARGAEQNIGGMLKQPGTQFWNFPNSGASDDYNFTAFPGGSRSELGFFHTITGELGKWWTATTVEEDGIFNRELYYNSTAIYREESAVRSGHSIRCIRE